MEDLDGSQDNHARYLPAVQVEFAKYVVKDPVGAAQVIPPCDLNFLRPGSPLWSYSRCLACAYYLMRGSSEPNMISHRQPGSWVLGDSGGFQIGTGALKGFEAPSPEEVMRLWRGSDYREKLLQWCESNCDYAMTLDLPLWVKVPAYAHTPFHSLSVEQLTDLTVENLRYFSDHRENRHCNFLNVLQGLDAKQDDYWYGRVKDFDFEGWAIGGSVAGELDLNRVLKRLLVMRDDKLLGRRRTWLHVLGMSQLTWAAALTAIQRAIQGSVSGPFMVSFDTATPTLSARIYQRVYGPTALTKDIKSWKIPTTRFPMHYGAAVLHVDKPFPAGSPLSSVLRLGDMGLAKGKYEVRRFNEFAHTVLTSHNTYALLAGVRAANRAAFESGPLPQALADLIGTIGDLFATENWAGLLGDKKTGKIIKAAGFATKEAALQ